MKTFLLIALFALLSSAAFAQVRCVSSGPTAPPRGFSIPNYGTQTWNILDNANFSCLDSYFANSVLLDSGSVNGIVYIGAGNPQGYAGRDIGAWINAAVSTLPLAGGYRVGTVVLPNSAGTTWATPVTIGPGTNLIGQGKMASNFSCTVSSGSCLTVDHSASSGQYAFTVAPGSKLENFSIVGNGAAGQSILHTKDGSQVVYANLFFDGASAAGGACVWLDDVNYWTERTTWIDVNTGYSCNISLRFTAETAGAHPSFGYNRFLDFRMQPDGAQTGISIENNSYVYNGEYHFTVNKAGAGAKVFHMQDNAWFYENELWLNGEDAGSGGFLFDLISSTNVLTYKGNIDFAAIANNFAAGSVMTHWGDSIYFSAGTVFQNSVTVNGGIHTDNLAGGNSVGYVTVVPVSAAPAYAFAVQSFALTNYFTVGAQGGVPGRVATIANVLDDGGGNAWFAGKTTLGSATTKQISSGVSTGSDLNGELTMSGGTNTYTFSGTYVSHPTCVASDETAIAAVQVSYTGSTAVVFHTSGATDVISYLCTGRN
jgi:hypothetical protein